MGKDFLKKLNSHHRSPTDTLPNNMGKLIISTEIICNKGKKNAADKYIFNQSVKNRNRRIWEQEISISKAQRILFS